MRKLTHLVRIAIAGVLLFTISSCGLAGVTAPPQDYCKEIAMIAGNWVDLQDQVTNGELTSTDALDSIISRTYALANSMPNSEQRDYVTTLASDMEIFYDDSRLFEGSMAILEDLTHLSKVCDLGFNLW